MKINRRRFLKNSLVAGSLLAGSSSFISGCSGISRSDMPDRSLENQSATQLDEVRNGILYYASLAPSGHNSQPWFVTVKSPNAWIIGADPQRRLPAVDPNNREAMLAIGAFADTEYFVIVAF